MKAIGPRIVMKMLKALFWGLLIASSLFGGEATAQKRIALVIGNSNYVNVRPLPNPENDANAIAKLFSAAGFETVNASNNLNGTEMRRAFRDFAEKSRTADVAVVFFAGHGIEIDGTNYLLPVDTSLKRDLDVEDEAISLDRIVRMLEPAKRLRLIILDACRDNPFIRTVRRTSETRSIGRGLAKIEPPSSDTLIAFAAKAGSTASDGDGRHSPFTAALLKNLTTPGLDLRIALGRVRDDVLSSTGNAQEPFVYGSLGGTTVSLLPEVKPVVAAPTPAVSPPATFDANASERRDYELAAQVATKEAWDSFLALHSKGFYADLARSQRSKLAAEEAKVATRTAPSLPAPSAIISSVAPTEAAKTGPDMKETTRLLHTELQRVGCYPGAVDASWGSNSRRALELFNKHSGKQLDTRVASLDAVDVLRGNTTRVCPLQCNRGYRAENDACVKIVCEAGSVVGNNGTCEKKQQPKTASRPDPAKPDRSAPAKPSGGAAPAQVVCGMNGCLPVPRGCRSELRATGRDNIAVVICNK